MPHCDHVFLKLHISSKMIRVHFMANEGLPHADDGLHHGLLAVACDGMCARVSLRKCKSTMVCQMSCAMVLRALDILSEINMCCGLWICVEVPEIEIKSTATTLRPSEHERGNTRCSLHVTICTFKSFNDTFQRQLKRADEKVRSRPRVTLRVVRNTGVEDKTPSVYPLKLFADCQFFNQVSQTLLAGGEIHGEPRQLAASHGPIFHLSCHEWTDEGVDHKTPLRPIRAPPR